MQTFRSHPILKAKAWGILPALLAAAVLTGCGASSQLKTPVQGSVSDDENLIEDTGTEFSKAVVEETQALEMGEAMSDADRIVETPLSD